MRPHFVRLLFCAWLICPIVLRSQETRFSLPADMLVPTRGLDTDVQDEVEQLDDGSLEASDVEAGDLERIAETRTYYLRRPLDLNRVGFDQLSELRLLSPAQVRAILQFRDETGDFITPYELQAIELLSVGDVRQLLPYVVVRQNVQTTVRTLGDRWRDAVGFAVLRTGYQSTTDDTDRWLGPRSPVYLRVRRTAGRQFSVGLVAENDAGERYGGPDRPFAFDYVSAHAFADDLPGAIKTVALGDYGVNWGQGLVNYAGFAAGKGAFAMNVQRNARWLQPHASVTEVGFFRGAATAVELGAWRAMLLASRTRLDGAVDTIGALGDLAFASSRLSGLQRTPGEVAGRNTNAATSVGGALAIERKWGRVSVHYLRHDLALPFGQPKRLYQRYNFVGNVMENASLSWQTFLGKLSWFGEAAVDGGGHTAAVTGLQTSFDRRTDISVVLRRYSPGYRTLYGNAFGNTRRPDTEEGLYLGTRFQAAPAWTLRGFVDVYRQPYARFRASRPGTSSDALLRLTYDKRRRYSAYAQLRHRSAERDEPTDASATVRTILPYVRSAVRLQGELRATEQLTLRARIEYARTQESGRVSDGTLVYQDVLFKPMSIPVSFTARIAIVDTDDFDSRIYAFENDLLYRFRIPAYYGRGTRAYLNVRWKASARLTAEVRGALASYRDREGQQEVTAQLRWAL